jgi:tetratricopeptide (TPR) repeat protein
VEARAIGRIEVPSAVRDLLEARLSDVSPEERTVLDVGAVQGYEFDPAVTARVLGLEKVTALQRIALLERRLGLIRGQERTCRFDHHLVQEVLYDALLPTLRAEYHARVGDALAAEEEITPRLAQRIAQHHVRGSRPSDAFPYLRRALDYLGREHRNQEKVELAEAALHAPGLEGERRVEVLLHKASALFVLGRRQENLDALREALDVAERVGDPAPKLHALLDLAALDVDRVDAAVADERVDEALALAQQLKDSVAEARAHTARGILRRLDGRLEAGIESLDRAVSLAHDAGEREVEARALANIALCMLQRGRNEEARTLSERSLLVTREAGRPIVGVEAMLNLAAAQSRLGDTLGAEEMQEQALELAASIGYRSGEAMAAVALGNTRSQLGRAADARRCFERALGTARETGERALEARVLGEWGMHWMSIGRADHALRALETSLKAQEELGDPVEAPLMRIRQSHIEAELGFEGYAFFVLGRIAENSGDVEGAKRRYRQSVHRRRDTQERTALAEVLGVLGSLELGHGSASDAAMYLREARAMARASTLPNLDAVAQVYLALTRHGDLTTAAETFAKQEMRIPHLARLRACFALWKASEKRPYLDEAARLLLELRDGAPPAWRKAVLGKVPLHADILEAARS